VNDWVVLGQITGLYGVQGWLKVYSYTEPRAGLLDYAPLYLSQRGEWRIAPIADGRAHGAGVLIKFDGYDDREAARVLIGAELAVQRAQLPPLPPGEYYWIDLQGLRVETVDGQDLGVVRRLFATGSNDVVVVQGDRERLIPFIRGEVVTRVDLEQRLLQVAWDPTF
jgi:16S rRNA processing protein RimM